MLRSGVLIAGKYRVIRKLGQGAMGSVWLAKNEVTDREFAIKVLLPEVAAAPTALARFFQEARICGALRHPSILEIYDAGTDHDLGGAPYLVMERLDGAPLDVLIAQRRALPPRVALDIVIQICRGLKLAHDKGVVHRDLKPANVFLHRPGTGAIEAKVLDFGVSKMVDQASPAIALTHTAAILGSPLYMSPEQMDHGRGLDARSDVHALGLLLWECLVGASPFASTTYNNLVIEIVRGPRPLFRDTLPSASPELAAIVERAFAIEPAARFASAADLGDALDVELTRLGGGVLELRNAATEILGGLDLASKAPPPLHSTTEPFSLDSQHDPPPRPTGSSSRTSFAETEVAPSAASLRVAPGAVPSTVMSAGGAPPVHTRGAGPLVAIGAALVVVVAAAGVFVATRATPKPAGSPIVGAPSGPSSLAIATTDAPTVTAAPTNAPSAAPWIAPPPSATASSIAVAPRVAPTTVPPSRKTQVKQAAPSASATRPRIDQSGL